MVVLAGLAATPAPAASTVAKHSLTPNVQLTTTRIAKKLVEERVLRVTPSTTSVPDIVPASSAYPMFDLTSTMAAHAGALAAVNGDFGTTKDQPTHTLMIDGELWTTGDTRGNAIGWSEQGTTFVAGQPALRISASTPRGVALFGIDDWNAHAPQGTSVSAYTARGGAVTTPPRTSSLPATDPSYCEARLGPMGGPCWTTGRAAIVRRYSGRAAGALPKTATEG